MNVDRGRPQVPTFGAFIDEHYVPWAREHLHKDDIAAQLKTDFADFLREPLENMNIWRLANWRRERLALEQPIVVNRQLQELSGCLTKAAEWSIIDSNPLKDLPLGQDVDYLIEMFDGGVGHVFLREGWGRRAVNATWTLGQRASIELPGITGDADYSLKLHIAGIFRPVHSAYQQVIVTVNGVEVGLIICRGSAVLEFFVPNRVMKLRDRIDLVLNLPNAARPIDYMETVDKRILALNIGKIELKPLAKIPLQAMYDSSSPDFLATALAQRAALQEMTSLGVNCEFGLVQRWVGAEQMSLFRWASVPLNKLVAALDDKLVGLNVRENLDIQVSDFAEFVAEHKVYGFQHHTFVYESPENSLERIRRTEYLRLGMLSRALLEDLRERTKLFVYHDIDKSNLPQIRELVRAINVYGKNTLLWIVKAPEESLVGTAREIEPGLIQGYVDGFQNAPLILKSPYLQSWLAAACSAHKIWSEARQPKKPPRSVGLTANLPAANVRAHVEDPVQLVAARTTE